MHRKILHGFNMEAVVRETKKTLAAGANEAFENRDLEETRWAMVDCLFSGSAGNQIPRYIVEAFSLDLDPDDEFFWDEVERCLDTIADDLNEHPQIETYDGTFFVDGFRYKFEGVRLGFGFHEYDCSWGLLVTWESVRKEYSPAEVRSLLEERGYTEVWGDASLIPHGGLFVKEYAGSFEVVELVDLDSAAGVDDTMLLIKAAVSFKLNRRMWLHMLDSMDTRAHLPDVARKDKAMARLVLAADIWSYGLGYEQTQALYIASDEAYPLRSGWAGVEQYDDIMDAIKAIA